MKSKFVLALALIICSAKSSMAQFGSGIVYDPTNYHNAVLRYLQLQQQLAQLRQTYTTALQQYQFIQSQARQIQNMARYRGIPSPWSLLSAADVLGNTGAWLTGVNTGDLGMANQGYYRVNVPLSNTGETNSSQNLRDAYGLEELSDGSTINNMATIGQLRKNAQQLELRIKQLEDDSLSSSPDLNTETAVLNKINAANVLLVRTMQDTNKLLVAMLEQQLLSTERNRTSNVGSINTELYRQQHFSEVMSFTSAMPTRLQTLGTR